MESTENKNTACKNLWTAVKTILKMKVMSQMLILKNHSGRRGKTREEMRTNIFQIQ